MLIITLSPYKPVDNLEHYATSYFIASDPTGTNILDQVVKSVEYINQFPSNLQTPLTTPYYYSYVRHIRDSTTRKDVVYPRSGWKEYRPIANTSNLVLYKEIVIDKPLIILNREAIEDTNNLVINIKTSDFRCNNDNHESTHWVILDSLDNVVFESLYDTHNKTSINIPKADIDYNSRSYLKVYVIHRSTVGVESDVGTVKLNVNESNFEIGSSLTRIIPYTTCRIKLKKIFPDLPLLTIRYELLSTQDDVLILKRELPNETTSIDIIGEVLEPDSSYYLDIYSIGLSGSIVTKRKLIRTVVSSNVDKTFNVDFKKEIKLVNSKPLTNNYVNNTTTYEDYNGIVPLVNNNDNKIYKGKYDRTIDSLVIDPLDNFKSASLVSSTQNSDLYTRMLDTSLLVVDTYVNTIPTFFIYRYDSYNDTCVLLHSMSRGGENKTIGYLNNVIVKDNNLYYIPYGTKNIIKYNYKDNNITTLDSNIPIKNYDKGLSLIEINNNRFLIIGGDIDQCIVFNPDNKLYNNAFPLHNDFRKCSLKTISLINGDALIFRIAKRDTDTEYDNVIYYDNFNNKMSYIKPDTIGGFYPSSITSLINGEVVLELVTETHVMQYKFA